LIDSVLTTQQGQYQITGIPPGVYYLLGDHRDLPGGYNATDAMMALQHFAQLDLLSPIGAKAGDVNNTGFVNASDALMIAQRFVGLQGGFPAGDWVFELRSIVISDSGDVLVQDLLGLCYGDVNGSFTPVPKQQAHAGLDELGVVGMSEVSMQGLPIRVEQGLQLGAASLVMHGVTVEDIEGISLGSKLGGDLVWSKGQEGLRVAWYNAEARTLKAGETLLRLHLSPGAMEAGIDLHLSPGSELADGQGRRHEMVKLSYPSLVLDPGEASLSLWPNPVEKVLMIRYTNPEAGALHMVLRDITNREVTVVATGLIPAGEGSWEVDFSKLPAGTYYLHLQRDGAADLMRKVLHIR
jgi:hypothetical protein